ncbi:MAG: DUF2793 domain-containing protein, partial [Pseudomonadota bacterium]
MSETSHHLNLPYILPSQAQKHVTHNEALRMLDAVVQLAVDNDQLTEPPALPVEGERHIIAANATGDWAGRDNQIAAFIDNDWMYFEPQTGWLVWNAANETLLSHTSTGWKAAGASEQVNLLGINGPATPNERLVVQSES